VSPPAIEHSGFFSAVGVLFTAARFIVGGLVSAAMAAESGMNYPTGPGSEFNSIKKWWDYHKK
jgi:hypothetical protein